jgi:Ca-activated chloride channel family protein
MQTNGASQAVAANDTEPQAPSDTAEHAAPSEFNASATVPTAGPSAPDAAASAGAPKAQSPTAGSSKQSKDDDAFRGLGLAGLGEGSGGRGEGVCLCGDGRDVSKAPRVRAGAVTVRGKLPPEVVQRIVRGQLGNLRRCYERALGANPALTGTVRVAFTIDTAGRVISARDAGSTLPDADGVACIVNLFAELHFRLRRAATWRSSMPGSSIRQPPRQSELRHQIADEDFGGAAAR